MQFRKIAKSVNLSAGKSVEPESMVKFCIIIIMANGYERPNGFLITIESQPVYGHISRNLLFANNVIGLRLTVAGSMKVF